MARNDVLLVLLVLVAAACTALPTQHAKPSLEPRPDSSAPDDAQAAFAEEIHATWKSDGPQKVKRRARLTEEPKKSDKGLLGKRPLRGYPSVSTLNYETKEGYTMTFGKKTKNALKDVSTEGHVGSFANSLLELGKIIGTDEQTRVSAADLRRRPQNMVGQLEGIGCTATLINKKLLITAAHCLYDRDAKAWTDYSQLEFVLAKNGPGHGGTRRFTVKQAHILSSYKTDEWHDMGWIHVQEESDSWLGTKADAGDVDVDIYGYPWPPAPSPKPQFMYHSSCKMDDKVWDINSYYTCDTEGGNSGSAVLDGQNRVVCVHDGALSSKNYCCMIETSVFGSTFSLVKAMIRHPNNQ